MPPAQGEKMHQHTYHAMCERSWRKLLGTTSLGNGSRTKTNSQMQCLISGVLRLGLPRPSDVMETQQAPMAL